MYPAMWLNSRLSSPSSSRRLNERGSIRAEVTPYDIFNEHGSEAAVKAAGKLQIEGQDYIVTDGDIMHVRFNV